jgi:hypothetical protein
VQERIFERWEFRRRQDPRLPSGRQAVHVAECEAAKHPDGSLNPQGDNRSGKYHGLFQADRSFSMSHARPAGTVRDAHTLSTEHQTDMAVNGYRDQGRYSWGPWDPACRP